MCRVFLKEQKKVFYYFCGIKKIIFGIKKIISENDYPDTVSISLIKYDNQHHNPSACRIQRLITINPNREHHSRRRLV